MKTTPALLAALFTLAFAASPDPAPAQEGNLTGEAVRYVQKPGRSTPVAEPLARARVLVGTGFNLRKTPTGHELRYRTIAADVFTNEAGLFSAQVPAGTYEIVVWKENHVPRVWRGVAAPGTVTRSTLEHRATGHSSMSLVKG